MSDYSRKITPVCCHAYRVNRVWEEAENRWVNRLTIEPQTIGGGGKGGARELSPPQNDIIPKLSFLEWG